MKKIVIDTSIAIKWFVDEPYSDLANNIFNLYKSNNYKIHVPSSIYLEFANVLWKYQKLKSIELYDFQEIFTVFKNFKFSIYSDMDLLEGAMEIALKYNRTVYDSVFVYLAKSIDAILITDDEKLVNSISKELEFVKSLRDFRL